ncbi:hypothetical protein Pla110_20900 [Polystyrenella longa]|uniref:Uncharacterized protein n=1 Tax=Polystyrenella longa TaxID=2528007 RepID=A0A518CMD7_9PLAN|nr:hypothetical protein [Polystyrenella longa]QDU80363.1 hypothetical protein Pla110_20900 [Polystyrenella longa]
MKQKKTLCMGLVLGVLAGITVSYCLPSQPTKASTVDRAEKFIMATCPVDGSSEAVFVLDLLSGQLRGAWLNPRSGRFTNFYSYNIAGDFNIDPAAGQPSFTLTTGVASLPNTGRAQNGNGVIYVAELTTGQVNAYMLQYNTNQNQQNQQAPITRLDSFPWRAVLE